MQFSGTVEIAAPRDRVWSFLMDPNEVGSCGPGVETIEVIDEDHFKAKAKVGVGFISARFVVDMTVAPADTLSVVSRAVKSFLRTTTNDLRAEFERSS